MEVNYFLLSFIVVPFIGFLLSALISGKKEMMLAKTAFYTLAIQLTIITVFIVYWLIKGGTHSNVEELTVYKSGNYEFFIDLFFDEITAVYLLVGAFVTFLITRYSAYYMHLEGGYKRFFNTVLFFYFGYNFTVLSGNFETLFIGWEILGISSFLLIAFYRDRYLPVRNAVKVFSIYRIGDVGILLAMWASHYLWHENITFYKLENYNLVHEHIAQHSLTGFLIGACILIAAAAKSAQLPYSSWLPRAMEGPTPSSAIFYGSLSVHFGVFLLLRTYPFWEQQISVRILIGIIGFLTAIVAFFITKVQATVKTQIAYASISQIGIMFVEIAFGLEIIALIHFAGNAFLRTYQLLVSPSVVSYKIRDQFYHFQPKEQHRFKGFLRRVEYSVYILSMNEWGLDKLMNQYAFNPLKKIGSKLNFLSMKNVFTFMLPAYLIALVFYLKKDYLPISVHHIMPYIFMFIGLLLSLKAFSERFYPRLAWWMVFFSHLWAVLAVSYNEQFDFTHTLIFLSGFVPVVIIGAIVLQYFFKNERNYFDMNKYYGHSFEYPKLSFLFLLCTLGLMGFPITLSFIGEDLVLSHIHEFQFVLAFFYALSYVMGGIALIRIYSRLFLGPHAKTYHQTTIKSA